MKWYLSLALKLKAFKLLLTYFHHSLILSFIIHHSCIAIQYFGWKVFTSYPNFRGRPWRWAYFGAKLAFIAGIFLKKYPWYMKIHFQFHFFAIWSILASILPIIAWKAPASSWSALQLAIFSDMYPRCFGPFGKFQDTKRISM